MKTFKLQKNQTEDIKVADIKYEEIQVTRIQDKVFGKSRFGILILLVKKLE
jgi:hypothetical protein